MHQNTLKKFLIIYILTINVWGGILFAKIKIIYPDLNKPISDFKRIHIVGISGKRIKIDIKINNSSSKHIKMKDEKKINTSEGNFYLFVKFISLKEGLNFISLKSGNYEENFYIEYNKNFLKENLKRKNFHMSENVIFCKKCHNFNKISECKKCHKRFTKAKYIHGPVITWQCYICHDKNNFFSLIQPVYSKCLKCHQEFTDNMYNAKFIHAPPVTGNCNICHKPHISQYKFFLKENIDKICVNCHILKRNGMHILKNKQSHKNISCIKCHNPHYGESMFLFVNKIIDKRKLCKRCHK